MNITKHALSITFLSVLTFAFSQTNDSFRVAAIKKNKKESRKEKEVFLEGGIGLNASLFRDYATSPLIYRTRAGLCISLGRRKIMNKSESNFEMDYGFGLYSPKADLPRYTSEVHQIQANYLQLFPLKEVLPEKWRLDVGFVVSTFTSFRINGSLNNNSFGYESFLNLMGSGRIGRDVSREEAKLKKMGFLKFKLKPKKRFLSFRFDPGIMNNSLRNGYAYIGQSGILNDEKPYDGYVLRLFSGLRFRTALEYTKHLKNGNGIRWSYSWDALKTGRDKDDFELVNSVLGVTVLFKSK